MKRSESIMSKCFLCIALCLLYGHVANGAGDAILIEAEGFADTGGWVVDPQFMDQMGSPYLLAHGLGRPVADAQTADHQPRTAGQDLSHYAPRTPTRLVGCGERVQPAVRIGYLGFGPPDMPVARDVRLPADPAEARGREPTARQLLAIGVERLEEFDEQPLVQARLMATLGGLYQQLGDLAAANSVSPRTLLILSYALCGFANFGSLGIMLGGLGAMAPERRTEIAALGMRSVLAGTLATLMTGAVVGMFV